MFPLLPPPNSSAAATRTAGFAIVGLATAAAWLTPLVRHLVLDIHVFTPSLILLNARAPKKKPAGAKFQHQAHRPVAHTTATATEAPNTPATSMNNTVAVVPGSHQWADRAAAGQHLDFQVEAINSLPVLKAHAVVLAFGVSRPRGRTQLFNLASRVVSQGEIAHDAVPRELDGVNDPDIEALRAAASRRLGKPAIIFACYSSELYNALRGFTESLLLARSVSPAKVRSVTVRLHQDAGRNFHLTLESFEI